MMRRMVAKESLIRRTRVSTRLAVLVAVVASGVCSGAVSRAGGPAPRCRNVVLVISDDQHWGDYGFMGHPHLRTPHLDRLARESLVFPRGYVPASLCCPSLASIITGRYPHEHGIVGNDPPERAGLPKDSPAARALFEAGREAMVRRLEKWPTLPQVLARRGFASLQTGKWWQGHYSRGGFTAGMTRGDRHGDHGLAIGRDTMQPIYDFIATCRAADEPFFVWYAPMLPHDPHDPPAELIDHYTPVADSIHVARYWANVERFDRSVGALLDHLDRERLSGETMVVYLTDNGWIQDPGSPRYAPRSKQSPYDGGLRTPIMLRQPGAIASGTNGSLAAAIDIAPTVLAACDVRAPVGLPGIDLLDPRAVADRKQIFGECHAHTIVDLERPAAGLRWRWTIRDRWKLVLPTAAAATGPGVGSDGGIAAELFDVVADPDERRDLAAEFPTLVRELTRSVDAWWDPAAPP